jgi:hypothetical protein
MNEEDIQGGHPDDLIPMEDGDFNEPGSKGAVFSKVLMVYLPWALAGIFFSLYVWGLGTAGAEERNRESYSELHRLISSQAPSAEEMSKDIRSLEELLGEFKEDSETAFDANNTALNLLLSNKDVSYLPRDRDSLASQVLLWANYQRNILNPKEREMQAKLQNLDEAKAEFRSQIIRIARELYFSSGLDPQQKEPVISRDDATKFLPLALREQFTEEDLNRHYRSVLGSFSQVHRDSLDILLENQAFREILEQEGVSISGTQQNFRITFWPTSLTE